MYACYIAVIMCNLGFPSKIPVDESVTVIYRNNGDNKK